MEWLITAVEGSAAYRSLSALNGFLWRIWQGSWLAALTERCAASVRRSMLASWFVESGRPAPSALAGRLRRAIGAESGLNPATRLEVFGLYFFIVFVPVELFLETRLPHTVTYLGDMAILLLGLGVALRLSRAGWPLRRTAADLPVMLLLGAALISWLWNGVPVTQGFFGVRAYLEYFVLYFVLIYLPLGEGRRREMLLWFLLLAAAIAVLGDAQKFLHVATPRQWLSAAEAATTRSFGTMGNPNTFGGFLVWALCLFVSLLLSRVRGGLRTLALVGIVLAAPALVFTLSREALLAFAAGALVIGVAIDRRFLLLLVVAAVALPIVDPHLVQRFTYALSSGYISTSSSYGRLLFWERGLQAFLAKPLLGWGPGTFGGSVAHLYGSPAYAYLNLGDKPIIDSQQVQTLVELGIVGYIAFLWLGVAAVRTGLRLFREDGDAFWRAIGLALAAGTVGLYIQCFFASLFETHPVIIAFWLVFGMAAWRVRSRADAGGTRDAAPSPDQG